MPYNQVLSKFKHGSLRSGSGKKVKKRSQAIAIMLSEKKKSDEGNEHYAPSAKTKKKMGLK